MSIESQGHFLPYIFQVLYVLCFTRPRYQVSVYRTIGPLVINRTVPFMSQSFIACSAILCPFMPNDRSLLVSSFRLIHSIPPQKLLCCLKLALYTRQQVHIKCLPIETYLFSVIPKLGTFYCSCPCFHVYAG